MTEPPISRRDGGPARTVASRPGARRFLDLLLDPGSWRSWDRPAPALDGDGARAVSPRAAPDEAVVSGEGRLRGRRVAVVVGEFGFLAGSVGAAAAERLVLAVERATAERLPLVASPVSGGMRMHEGTAAFVQMARIAGAITRHKAAALPYLVYLRHPTTGGGLASWGSLGHVTFAEPGALLGLVGPRVYQQLSGHPFPEGVQTAENLHAHGLLDGVVTPRRFVEIAAEVLAVLHAPAPRRLEPVEDPRDGAAGPHPTPDLPAWDVVLRSRRADRPGLRTLLAIAARDVTVLDGTGAGVTDPGLVLALARLGDSRCVVVGQDRHAQRTAGPIGPAGLHKARRGMRLAAELGLPVVTVVDTPGASLSPRAEEAGLAREIARCLETLLAHPTPTLSVLLGEGTGGAAIALLPADRTVAAQHAWLAPLPMEGASAILYRTTDRAAEVARDQGIRSLDLVRLGVVDRIVAERPDAADEPGAFCRRLGGIVAGELDRLAGGAPTQRVSARLRRYRNVGRPRDGMVGR
ncbi:MAG TPA: carboxyl transferase domain-containing protein [Actinomycetota bacterium]|nr:carboxyl transferase domain-containing protein [Actinomycetota bacterium]